MSRGVSLQQGQLLARSLKVSRSTHLVVATVAAAVAANAAAAILLIGFPGQIALLGLIFVTLAAGTSAISSDIYARSSQTIANLRSIGASSRSLSSAVFFSVIGYGIAGSALGAGIGSTLGVALGGQGGAVSVLVAVVGVILASSAAAAAGVYAGGRRTWSS
ncbi:MAG TPA: hypothetical protein VED22_00260 [Nitrososphaerales archaeon]|nr:hypothetical protein [Nitrososphaerales archaeon]